jgi:hypothetical protein
MMTAMEFQPPYFPPPFATTAGGGGGQDAFVTADPYQQYAVRKGGLKVLLVVPSCQFTFVQLTNIRRIQPQSF